MRTFGKPSKAIEWTKERLSDTGFVVKTEKWQGIDAPDSMWETLNHSFQFMIPHTKEELILEIRPNLPWADEHFEERISGVPLNPPPSHNNWPFAQRGNEKFGGKSRFSHTYPERIWPKKAGKFKCESVEEFKEKSNGDADQEDVLRGIRFKYGDFGDVIDLLEREPFTRQAFLPIWFPEDTGTVHNERVPCTIGYHFIRRGDYFHVVYFIRSCDFIRHFRDDLYMACRKLFWALESLKERDPAKWKNVVPGYFSMHITSLHCFYNERGILKLAKT
jgi:hypothetical protein